MDTEDDHSREASPSINERNDREVERQGSLEPPAQSSLETSVANNADEAAAADDHMNQDEDSETDPDSDYDEAMERTDMNDWFSMTKVAGEDEQTEPESTLEVRCLKSIILFPVQTTYELFRAKKRRKWVKKAQQSMTRRRSSATYVFTSTHLETQKDTGWM